MNTFITDFKRSLYDFKWYKEIERGEHPLRISYTTILSLISALVTVIVLTISLYTILIPSVGEEINKQFPEDLVITIKSGELSINQPMPYRFEFSEEEKKNNKEGKFNILVIDTEAEADLDSTQKYETYAFANKTTVVIEEDSPEIKAYPLKDFPDTVLSRDSIQGWFGTFKDYSWILPIIVFPFVAFYIFVCLLILFLVSGGLLWIIMKIASRDLSFARAFAISMYAYTFIFILDLVLLFVYGSFGFLVSVLITVLLGCLFLFMPDQNVPVTNDPL